MLELECDLTPIFKRFDDGRVVIRVAEAKRRIHGSGIVRQLALRGAMMLTGLLLTCDSTTNVQLQLFALSLHDGRKRARTPSPRRRERSSSRARPEPLDSAPSPLQETEYLPYSTWLRELPRALCRLKPLSARRPLDVDVHWQYAPADAYSVHDLLAA